MSVAADNPPAEPEPPCPKCGSTRTIPILYGFPSEEMEDAAIQGTAELGGCDFVISAGGKHPPQSACKACGAKWWPMGNGDLRRPLNR